MPRSRSRLSLLAILPLVIIPVVCGVIFLAQNAPRDWSLHWVQPRTAIASTSSTDFSAVSAPHGYDIAWERPNGALVVSRFNSAGHALSAPISLKGSPEANSQSITLARSGPTDIIVWREDLQNGSRLRAAIVRPGALPVYRTLANGPWSLEHPRAFVDGNRVDVVFSWQRGSFDVYLSQIAPNGSISTPRPLTHVTTYAFNPHAVVDAAGDINLMYMQSCCQGSMKMMYARYSDAGRLVSPPRSLATITSVSSGSNSSSTPDRWGLDIVRDGSAVVSAWSGDDGIMAAAWHNGRSVVGPHVALPGVSPPTVVYSIAGNQRELVWPQGFDLGSMLATVRVNRALMPTEEPDRVAFQGESDDVPVPVVLHNQPGLLWQAAVSGTNIYKVEESRFTPQRLGAPNAWARLGLGLANPMGNFAILLLGGLAVGVLLAAANVLLIIALVALYLVGFRKLEGRWKWYVYAVAITVVLFVLFISMGAPAPPVLFLTGFSQNSGLLALGGTLLFIVWMARTVLRRIDDVYRASLMAAGAFFFIGFLQALLLMQGQIGRI